ncbi:unnamed protein product, partial [Rangifer tarandus platyrhynchus]
SDPNIMAPESRVLTTVLYTVCPFFPSGNLYLPMLAAHSPLYCVAVPYQDLISTFELNIFHCPLSPPPTLYPTSELRPWSFTIPTPLHLHLTPFSLFMTSYPLCMTSQHCVLMTPHSAYMTSFALHMTSHPLYV